MLRPVYGDGGAQGSDGVEQCGKWMQSVLQAKVQCIESAIEKCAHCTDVDLVVLLEAFATQV